MKDKFRNRISSKAENGFDIKIGLFVKNSIFSNGQKKCWIMKNKFHHNSLLHNEGNIRN